MKQRIFAIGVWTTLPFTTLMAMPSANQTDAHFANVPASTTLQAAPPQPGPETIDAPEKIGYQGNWVKKREWLIQAHQVNTEIQEIAVQIETLRKTFIDKYSAVDGELDQFYQELGFNQGKLQELFESLFRYLEKKKQEVALTVQVKAGGSNSQEITAQVDTLEDAINASKKKLEQLKLDMKSIEDLGQSLVDRLNRLDEQLNIIQRQAERARSLAHELWSIIDHNKARNHYYEIKLTILENIKNIQTYLSNDLSQDFDAVIATIKTQKTKTLEQIKQLEADGFFIKNRAERVKEAKAQQAELKQQQLLQAQQLQAAATTQSAKMPASTGFFSRMYNAFISCIVKIYDLFSRITSIFVGKQAPPEQMVPPKPTTLIPQMPQAQTATPTSTQQSQQ